MSISLAMKKLKKVKGKGALFLATAHLGVLEFRKWFKEDIENEVHSIQRKQSGDKKQGCVWIMQGHAHVCMYFMDVHTCVHTQTYVHG